MTLITGLPVPVAAIPAKGPVLSLLSSSIAPATETDDFQLDEQALEVLPRELVDEIKARSDEMWTRGFGWTPDFTYASAVQAADDLSSDDYSVPGDLPAIQYFQPYLVKTVIAASAFGWSEVDYQGRAQRALDLLTPSLLEAEFWDGTLAQAKSYPNNFLTNAGDANFVDLTPSVGTPVSIARGLAILQQALGDSEAPPSDQESNIKPSGQGMIHMPLEVSLSLLNVRRVGKLMLDVYDNIIVPGTGYSGDSPLEVELPEGSVYMYATDMVMTRIGKPRTFPETLADALDRGQGGQPNLVTFRAERFVAAYWDNLRHFGVYVNLPT